MQMTPAREDVLELLTQTQGREHRHTHMTVKQISQSLPDYDLSTLYRACEALAQAGLICEGREQSELLYSGHANHVHVVCRVCGRTLTLPAEHLANIRSTARAERMLIVAHPVIMGECFEH